MADSRVRLVVNPFVVAMLIAGAVMNLWSDHPVWAQRVATAADHAGERQRVTVDVENVPLVTALDLIARQAGLAPAFTDAALPANARVTLHLNEASVADAFRQALRGTDLIAKVHSQGAVTIVRSVTVTTASGTITGQVTDARTKQPLRGGKIGLDGSDRITEVGEDGTYRLVGVSLGEHTLSVKVLGYAKVVRTVSVQDGQTTTLNIALDPAATALDQVVVTGTIIPTELKAVPNAMTVITAKQIEERGITKIDQLFRGDVPGLFAQNRGSAALLDEVTMFSRGTTSLNRDDPLTGTTFLGFTNPIKTYVDGVELADPKYLSQIDPKSIERIEILTGPQASTIYGSNAINGVMQIFTKRGTSNTPQLTLNLLSGWVENNFSSARTPQHDYSAQLSGVEGRISYNAGSSWNYIGPWTPAKKTARTGGFGGARLEFPSTYGRVTADITFRRTITQNLQRGDASQTFTGYAETGLYSNSGSAGLSRPQTSTLDNQTLGVTLSYAPASWWSHEFGIGQDVSNIENRVTARGYANRSDTTLRFEQNHEDRRSLRYVTTAHVPLSSLAQTTVTLGTDGWQNVTSSLTVSPQTLSGSLTGTTTVSRQPGHNAGGFLQTQLGIKDQLFFTYGLRAEWNPNYGKEAQPNYAPRYGIAYTQELGLLTAKLRGSYGRSTRPPQPTLKTAQTIADYYGTNWPSASSYYLPYYGLFAYQLANSELGPEHQQGGEGGLELYLGARGSLVITRYNQTVDGLIASPVVDSIRSLVVCADFPCAANSYDADGYGYNGQYQYLNLGSIRNQGWELQGSLQVGPLMTKGTYSWTKSRTIGINQKYRAQFPASGYPQYQPGATFQFLPEHTWAMGVTYVQANTTVGFNITGTGQIANSQDAFYYQSLTSFIRLWKNRLNVSNPYAYINFNNGYVLADLTASRRFVSRVEGVLQIQNLTNRYTNDYGGNSAVIGRQLKVGCRVRAN